MQPRPIGVLLREIDFCEDLLERDLLERVLLECGLFVRIGEEGGEEGGEEVSLRGERGGRS